MPDRTGGGVLDHDASPGEFVAQTVGLGEVLVLTGRGAGGDEGIDLAVVVAGGVRADREAECAGEIDDRGKLSLVPVIEEDEDN